MTDLDLIDLAATQPRYAHAGAFEQAVTDATGRSVTRFWQDVNRLIDDPVILAARPVEVSRLRRLRAARSRARSGGAMPR